MKTREEKQRLLDRLITEHDLRYGVTETWRSLVLHADSESEMRGAVLERKSEEGLWKFGGALGAETRTESLATGLPSPADVKRFTDSFSQAHRRETGPGTCGSPYHLPPTLEELEEDRRAEAAMKREEDEAFRERTRQNGGKPTVRDIEDFARSVSTPGVISPRG